MSDSMRPHRQQPTRLHHPWDSPDKNTGVGCHFLLQCMKVKSESEVAQSCLTLCDPWTAAYQAPPSMGFSRQEYWSEMPLPSPTQLNKIQQKERKQKKKKKKEVEFFFLYTKTKRISWSPTDPHWKKHLKTYFSRRKVSRVQNK